MEKKSPKTTETVEQIKTNVSKSSEKIKQDKLKNEALEKLTTEINEYTKNPDIGVDYDKLHCYIHNHRWHIKSNAHISSIRNSIRDWYIELLELPSQIKTSLDVYKIQPQFDALSKKILETGLSDFDYDKEADDPELGPVALKLLAQELAAFLVVRGGKVAATHSKMLQKQALLEHLND